MPPPTHFLPDFLILSESTVDISQITSDDVLGQGVAVDSKRSETRTKIFRASAERRNGELGFGTCARISVELTAVVDSVQGNCCGRFDPPDPLLSGSECSTELQRRTRPGVTQKRGPGRRFFHWILSDNSMWFSIPISGNLPSAPQQINREWRHKALEGTARQAIPCAL